MGIRVTRILNKRIYSSLSVVTIASTILLHYSIALAQTSPDEKLSPFRFPSSQSKQLFAEYVQDSSENVPSVQLELILAENYWRKLNPQQKSQDVPVKIRITNSSQSPIIFSNLLPRAFFDFSIVDEDGKFISYPPTYLGGRESFSYIGEAFSKEKYGKCPVLLPQEKLEADWTFHLDWKDEDVLIELRLNPSIPTHWRFKASRTGTYKMHLNYKIPVSREGWCVNQPKKNTSSASLLNDGHTSSTTSEIKLVFEPR
jgi:hypothetical protein